MLNHEGWSLLMILCAFIALLLLALPHMHTEKSVSKRLSASGGWMQTAAGITLCTCGVLVLAVIPAAMYRGGVLRAGLPASGTAGVAVLMCVLVPRIRARDPQALTLCQALAQDKWTRAGLGTLSAGAALVSAAAAVSMMARLFAYVFSLHYLIALGASVGLVLVLTLLCGAQSRLSMNRLQIVLTAVLLVGAPVAALCAADNASNAWQMLAQPIAQERYAALYVPTDLCAGFGMLGLLFPVQALFSVQKTHDARKSGIAASVCIGVLMLFAAVAGLAGRAADILLENIPASETMLMQIAEQPLLPEPVSALLTTALVTTLLLFAQAALQYVGMSLAWDVVQPVCGLDTDRRLSRLMDGIAVTACVLTYPLGWNANTPLAWYVCFVLLCGAVTGSTLLVQACSAKVSRVGGRIGLAAGAATVLVVLMLPIPEKWKLLGVIPAAIATMLPQLFVKDKPMENKSA